MNQKEKHILYVATSIYIISMIVLTWIIVLVIGSIPSPEPSEPLSEQERLVNIAVMLAIETGCAIVGATMIFFLLYKVKKRGIEKRCRKMSTSRQRNR